MPLPGNEHLTGYSPVHFGSHRDAYSFAGTFAGLEEGQTKYGPAPVYRFEGEPQRILWGYHAGLRRAWKEASPQAGETVRITRSENRIPFGDEGKAAYVYTVDVERSAPEAPPSSQNAGETGEEVFGF
jgi:hypothetical protein